MTMKFTLADTATLQKHVRTVMNNGALNVSQAFEICHEVFTRAPKRTNGYHVNNRGELKPIPGAITGYDSDGRPVIAEPIPQAQEPKRKLTAVSIEALCDVDGRVDEAESHEVSPDDSRELSVEELQTKIDIAVEVAEREVGVVPEPESEETWQDAVIEDGAETSDAGSRECQ